MKDKVLNNSRINISKNNLETALLDMLKYLEGNPKVNELIIISQNFHLFSEDKRKGVLPYEQQVLQQNRIANSLLELINQIDKENTENYFKNFTPLEETTLVLKELVDILEVTYGAFIAQAKIRNLLMCNMVNRLKIKELPQYEVFFSTYFSKMNNEELRLHNTIRSYTENVLGRYNQQALDLVKLNKKYKTGTSQIKRIRNAFNNLVCKI
ncbi:MAG: hypothetical protein IPP06_15860 [Saprospiraceae bacterium]|nr:hypothetical protein [Candidatus Vicinibacter affinis]